MTTFWLGVAGLLAITLTLLLSPLLRRRPLTDVARERLNVGLYRERLQELEQELAAGELARAEFEASVEELQRDLLSHREGDPAWRQTSSVDLGMALLLGLLLPALAIALYWRVGNPELITGAPVCAAAVTEEMEALMERLNGRLEQNPADVEGWILLGRSYFFLRRFAEAAQAFERAVALTEPHPDPDLLAEYGDALAFTQGGSLEGKPMALVRRALAIDPEARRALWLAGTYAYENGDIAVALSHWRRLAALLPPGDDFAPAVQEAIAEAEQGHKRP